MFKLRLLTGTSLMRNEKDFNSLSEAINYGLNRREKFEIYDSDSRMVCESDGNTLTNFLTE